MPELDARALAAGLSLSILVAILAILLGFPAIGALVGVAAGGYTSGRMAGRDGLYHGAVVGVLAIVVVELELGLRRFPRRFAVATIAAHHRLVRRLELVRLIRYDGLTIADAQEKI